MSTISNRFVTETDVEEAKKKRAEEWEKARAAGRELPEEEPEQLKDTRSLYERLKEQKDNKQEAFEDQLKFKNMIYKGLNTDEKDFLDLVAVEQAKMDGRRFDQESLEIKEYRSAKENMLTVHSSVANDTFGSVAGDDVEQERTVDKPADDPTSTAGLISPTETMQPSLVSAHKKLPQHHDPLGSRYQHSARAKSQSALMASAIVRKRKSTSGISIDSPSTAKRDKPSTEQLTSSIKVATSSNSESTTASTTLSVDPTPTSDSTLSAATSVSYSSNPKSIIVQPANPAPSNPTSLLSLASYSSSEEDEDEEEETGW